jgi:hypothetical protein
MAVSIAVAAWPGRNLRGSSSSDMYSSVFIHGPMPGETRRASAWRHTLLNVRMCCEQRHSGSAN